MEAKIFGPNFGHQREREEKNLEMRLTVDVIQRADLAFNPLQERELNLRGLKISEIENLSIIASLCMNFLIITNILTPITNL